MEDASGEPVVVVAVALGMPADVLQRILLCLKPAISESIRRIHELALLHEDMEQTPRCASLPSGKRGTRWRKSRQIRPRHINLIRAGMSAGMLRSKLHGQKSVGTITATAQTDSA